MYPAPLWQEDQPSPASSPVRPATPLFSGGWPARVASALWRGDQLCAPVSAVWPSGFAALDAHLPGGGWPGHGLTEILCAPGGILEWRLLAPALRPICAAGQTVVLLGPPLPPHPPGLRFEGLDERHLVWVQADTTAERLWSTEQLIKAQACGALVAWLPRAKAAQIRRLQVLATSFEAPVFVCRPVAALRESSAAPLRLQARVDLDWALHVDIVKRKGPPLEQTLRLASVPGALAQVLTPRMRQPSRLMPLRTDPKEGNGHVVVRAPAEPFDQRHRSPAH
ncbi:translesion DNA synthesis-associated protein ImuA [Hydrogenophaga sp. BPS33]|uniref:translesion DNA synthesis-associated protein ImuA n=1 Tax=Hydrogenophaga sp. BPS33 TaxID=2651974 RepID=UPI00132023C4|nr:translesion DNA synthesis-associated protein ImuA [Hydrogenophaga sp. BPS33]QHE86563.1 translesion DNA synthesis-associated protein ImuA [Hydrogenophaga sp. BPS33]